MSGVWPGRKGGQRGSRTLPLAIVQHGQQYLITDGYDSREGLSEVLESFAAVFALHLRYGVPFHLHLSGTLIEAIAWYSPQFFDWIKALRQRGLVELLGSAYAQNIMPLFSAEHNLRQLNESLRLYRRHLEVEPTEVRGFWVPERVWDTERLAPVLRSSRLANGGYHYVLLDDRLSYPLDGSYEGSERQRFDGTSAPALVPRGEAPRLRTMAEFGGGRHLEPYWIEGGDGLAALPISGELRYFVPPLNDSRWDCLLEALRLMAAHGPGSIAVYGDDLEKTAAVGPWGDSPWRPERLRPYEEFLAWLREEPMVQPVLLSPWLAEHPPRAQRRVDAGTYYELAHAMGAGEDYRRWWLSPEWRPYRELLTEAEALLLGAGPLARSALGELAWKHLMACSYETGWHVMEEGGPRPAPWSRALAAQARTVRVMLAAARWQQERDGKAHAQLLDIDDDGHLEVVLKGDCLYAVLSPDYGGRLVYLFELRPEGGCLVVGNPADDWNWQEEPNRFMEVPRNHPGGFADVGHENERYLVRSLKSGRREAEVHLTNAEAGSPLFGTRKVFRLRAAEGYLEVAYRLPRGLTALAVECCLSPDYLVLLRGGRRLIRPFGAGSARGWRNGPVCVWVRLPSGEPVAWDTPAQEACGHGMMLRLTAYGPDFRLQLGTGLAVPAEVRGL
ncbi:Alpha-amylase 1 [bacterium HR25]|nr:Alpha-amylase 1 [bacterium HR25]